MSAQLTLNVTACTEFQPGEFTQAMHSNLVELITAGKPLVEHGLLVPLQVCGNDRSRHIHVALKAVISEAGTLMTTPPPFYMYCGLDWPAPKMIQAHNPFTINVTGQIRNDEWELRGEIRPGLYLLVFERDHYLSSTASQDIPASVTYRLEIEP